MAKRFEILEHPADVGFLAFGETLEELFENAAVAMSWLGCAPEKIEEKLEREVAAEGADIESLLYAWLAEILAVMDAEQIVCRRVDIKKFLAPKNGQTGEARGILHGEKFDRQRHSAGTYIKAVTLHQFRVEQDANGFRARVFLDL
jgi:SHS2 domain-containing protein